MTVSLREIKVYTTFPHDCSYLKDKQATTLFIDPRQSVDIALYSKLSQLGFRRSGDHVYRPHCARCSACIPSRVVADTFQQTKSQARVWRKNRDVVVIQDSSISDDATYDLYERYITARHADGDMYPPNREQYDSFLNRKFGATCYFRLYVGERLIGVAVADRMLDGYSAIYTFYDPDEERRSLGTFAVLWQIHAAQERGLPYVYLGYWIEDCLKMNYKTRFQPLELFVNGEWNTVQVDDISPSNDEEIVRIIDSTLSD